MNTVIYYKHHRFDASHAGVAKSGQRRWIQGPVVQTFVGSNPIPRTTDIYFVDRFVPADIKLYNGNMAMPDRIKDILTQVQADCGEMEQ